MNEHRVIRSVALTASLVLAGGIADSTAGTRANAEARKIAVPLRDADFALSLQIPFEISTNSAETRITQREFSVPWIRRKLASARAGMAVRGRDTARIKDVEEDLSASNPDLLQVQRDIDRLADSLENEGLARRNRGKAVAAAAGVIFLAAVTTEED